MLNRGTTTPQTIVILRLPAEKPRYGSVFALDFQAAQSRWFVVVIRQDREWNHPDVLDEEPYALVVTVADRDNEDAQLYTQIQAVIAQQAAVRERQQVERLQARR